MTKRSLNALAADSIVVEESTIGLQSRGAIVRQNTHQDVLFLISSRRLKKTKVPALTRIPLNRPAFRSQPCALTTSTGDQSKDLPPLRLSVPEYSTRFHPNNPRSPDQSPLYSRSHGHRARSPPPHPHRFHMHNGLSQTEFRPLQLSPELPDRQTRTYSLEIVQHPLKTAEFGSSPLTRLPLAPPLIAQLHVRDQGVAGELDESELPFLVAQISLHSDDGTTPMDVATIGQESRGGRESFPQRLLYGNLVSSPHILRNLQGRQGVYFLFPDVSIRWQGRFLLYVTLIKLPGISPTGVEDVSEQGTVLARARTLPFDVQARNNYVAPAQTPLTQYFLQQGARMSTTCCVRRI